MWPINVFLLTYMFYSQNSVTQCAAPIGISQHYARKTNKTPYIHIYNINNIFIPGNNNNLTKKRCCSWGATYPKSHSQSVKHKLRKKKVCGQPSSLCGIFVKYGGRHLRICYKFTGKMSLYYWKWQRLDIILI